MNQPDFQTKTILIVDDDAFFLEVIKLMLENIGFKKLETAMSYDEAVNSLESKMINLVLLDIELDEERSGIDFAEHVQQTQPDLPIVFLTATYDEQVYEKARLTNPFSFLNKNLSQVQLRQAIELPLKMQQNNAQKLAEQQERAMEHTKQLKTEFISSMNHQIRTPMNSIIGLTELLLQSAPSKFQDTLKDLQFAGDNLMKLLKDILDLSRLKQGQVELKSEQFILQKHLTALVERFKKTKSKEGVELDFKLTGWPLRHKIVGDVEQLIHILDHLMDNAFQFTNEGKVELSVDVEEVTGHRAHLCFGLKDTGIGIEEERLPFIFESFSEMDNVKEKQFAGSGLGLSITKLLVDLYGSKLKVKSRIGKGTSIYFKLVFPLGTELDEPSEDQLAGLSVLLVEDNLLNQRLALKALEKKGMNVSVANHGAAALELIESQVFDVILMDVNMPVMDGMTASERIRNLKDVKSSIPIILVASISQDQVSVDMDRLRINGHLGKPFKPTELYAAIYRALYIGL